MKKLIKYLKGTNIQHTSNKEYKVNNHLTGTGVQHTYI